MKTCNNCKRDLPLANFSNSRGTRDGKKYECKECDYARQKAAREADKGDSKVYKVCTLCGRRKPLTAYFRDKRRVDGRMGMCKVCRKQEYGENHWGWRVCKYCNDDLDESAPKTGDVCEICSSKTRGWLHGVMYLCVRDPGPGAAFKGGHFSQLEVSESLKAGYWDVGTVFELWNNGKYVSHYEVTGIPMQKQTLEEIEGMEVKGDGRFLTV